MTANPYAPPKASLADATPYHVEQSTDDISLSEFEAFTGKCAYPKKLKHYQACKAKHAGFNFWAALFGVQWFVFRKLYFSAVAAVSLEIGLPVLFAFLISFTRISKGVISSWLILGVFVAARVCIGYFANVALFWKAEAAIRKVDSLNLDNETHLRHISQAGGVSIPALLLVYVALGVLRVLAWKS